MTLALGGVVNGGDRRATRGHDASCAMVYPTTGTATPVALDDVFGFRRFLRHASDLDLHRGVDWAGTKDDAVYSPIDGAIVRLNYTHFHFGAAAELALFTAQDESGHTTTLATDALQIAHGASATTFDTTIDCPRRERKVTEDGDVEIRCLIDPGEVADGDEVGIYLIDDADATTWCKCYFTSTGGTEQAGHSFRDGGAVTDEVESAAHATRIHLRIDWTQSDGSYTAYHSADGNTWNTIGTGTATSADQPLVGMYVASAGAAVTGRFDWFQFLNDEAASGRFGNYVEIVCMSPIAQGSPACVWLMHLNRVDVSQGDVIKAGAQVGTMGNTGFDSTSGNIITQHVHMEWEVEPAALANSIRLYDNDRPVNPMHPSLMPRVDNAKNLRVAISEDGTDYIFEVKVRRSGKGAQENFDANSFAFDDGVTTKTINWDTRAGLDPADHDAADYDGVAFAVADSFDSTYTWHTVTWSCAKATFTEGQPTLTVKDSAGTTIAAWKVLRAPDPTFDASLDIGI